MRRTKAVSLLTCACLGLSLMCACSSPEKADDLGSSQSTVSADAEGAESETDVNEEESTEKESEGTGEHVQLDAAEYDKVKSVTIAGTSYTLPASGSDLAAAGWETVEPFEMEADDTGVIYWTPYVCNCYNPTLDSYAEITFRNQTGHAISSLNEAEVAGIKLWEGDLSDSSSIAVGEGVSLGDSFDDALAAFGEPHTNGVASLRNQGATEGVQGAVIWYFDGPDETGLRIQMMVDYETNKIVMIDSLLESY